MKRTHAFLITLFLWLILGAGASVMIFHPRVVSTEAIEEQPSETKTQIAETKTETEAIEFKTEGTEIKTIESETEATEIETIKSETETPEATEIPLPEPEEEALESVSPAELQHSFTVSSIITWLHIRKQPSSKSEVLGKLHSGDSGKCTIIDDHWVRIEYKQREGYLSRKYITLDE